MLISFIRLKQSDPEDVPVRRYTSATPTLREYGQLEIWLPETAAAYDEDFISEDEPFRVLATGEDMPAFPGICLGHRPEEGGTTISAFHIAKQFDKWPLPADGPTFYGVTAGAIMRWCAQNALAGAGEAFLVPGDFVEAAPRIVRFKVQGQTFAEACSLMMEQSGQEYEIGADYTFNWIPSVGRWRPTVHVDGGLLFPVGKDVSFENQALAVSGKTMSGQPYTVRVG